MGGAGLLHAVGLAVGGDDDGVMEEPVEEADGGGVFWDEPGPQSSNGQWDAMPSERRS